jgi:hypothetical protein
MGAEMTDNGGVFREWSKRYLFEYLVVLILCLATAGFCIPLARAATTRSVQIVLLAGPTAAILLMPLVVYRHYRRVDEFLRHVMLESFAAAGAFASVWTLVYAVCELAGLPRISMWWVWGSMVLVWNLWIFGRWAFRG